MKKIVATLILCLLPHLIGAQEPYPYPVNYMHLSIENKDVQMAYMDVPATHPNGKTVILFHGKNFNGYYWKDVIAFLSSSGYRVIVPDQPGWGKSSKPDIHYSFHQLAAGNKVLLDSLHISEIIVIGHSMGGMLATRFALLYPGMVSKLVLEDPIGLEDYRTFVPYTPIETEYKSELYQTYERYKKYMKTYFPEWKDEYEELVKQQAAALRDPDFKQIALANALTYEMIYEQPVCYEFRFIKARTLLIIGTADRTIVGKDKVPEDELNKHGQYPQLGKKVAAEIKDCRLVELPGVGHIPHIQQFSEFKKAVASFLSEN